MGGAAVAWVALGSNLGRRGLALAALRAALAADGDLAVRASPVLVTRPVGMTRQPDFHNQVLRLRAREPLPARAWLDRCQAAERQAGRRPTYRWGPRRADADLLLLGEGGEVSDTAPGIVVPHPALADRPFLCALLAALEPGLTHPDGWRVADRAGAWTAVLPALAAAAERP